MLYCKGNINHHNVLSSDFFWAKQITGALRHSASNRGIETFSKIFEGKMNDWILEMNSLAWAIEYFYAVQRINVEIIRSLGNKLLCELLAG